jgi:hypothetical protein
VDNHEGGIGMVLARRMKTTTTAILEEWEVLRWGDGDAERRGEKEVLSAGA